MLDNPRNQQQNQDEGIAGGEAQQDTNDLNSGVMTETESDTDTELTNDTQE